MDPFDKKINKMKKDISDIGKEIKAIQKVRHKNLYYSYYIIEKQSSKRKIGKKNRQFKE